MDKWEDTVMTYEQARARDDATEKQYKKLKGYKGLNWAYTNEDRRTLRAEMEWDKLRRQAEISFKAGEDKVVEWVQKNYVELIPYFQYSEPGIYILTSDWQAFLKERGI